MREKLYSISLIEAERFRQINEEGYTAEHDDVEKEDDLSTAGALYALNGDNRGHMLPCWPYDFEYWKPDKTHTIEGRIKELSKAGALIAAEIDRLNRKIKNNVKKSSE